MQKSRNHIFLVKLVPGGKGEDVDTTKFAIRRIPDEFLNGIYRFRLCRLSQSIEESVSFVGTLHGTFGLITIALTLGPQTRESSNRFVKDFSFDAA